MSMIFRTLAIWLVL